MYIGCYDRPVKSGSMISMLANRRQKDVLRDRNTSKVSLTKDKRGLAVTDRTGSGVKERDSLTNSK